LVMTDMSPFGTSLDKAESPYELMRAGGHAMIGLYNAFRKDFIHRDISNGNIPLLHAEERKTKPDFNKIKKLDKADVTAENTDEVFQYLDGLEDCRAVLIDGDQAVDWIAERAPAKSRSVTLPFVSMRLLDANLSQIPTPADDLEAVLWTVVWAALRRLREPTIAERAIMAGMSSDDIVIVGGLKSSFLRHIAQSWRFSADFQPYHPLLQAWARTADITADTLRESLEGVDDSTPADAFRARVAPICERAFRQYLFDWAIVLLDLTPPDGRADSEAAMLIEASQS